MASFTGGMVVGSGMLAYNGVMMPGNPMNFEALTVLLSIATTGAILAISATWFPATGDAAERASKFCATLRRPATPAEAGATNPTPIAGVVVATMGFALIIVGLGVFPATRLSPMTLGLAVVLTGIGLGMILPGRFGQRRAGSAEATVPARRDSSE